jgi:hypothetical protein
MARMVMVSSGSSLRMRMISLCEGVVAGVKNGDEAVVSAVAVPSKRVFQVSAGLRWG